jgi:hypothetical protein
LTIGCLHCPAPATGLPVGDVLVCHGVVPEAAQRVVRLRALVGRIVLLPDTFALRPFPVTENTDSHGRAVLEDVSPTRRCREPPGGGRLSAEADGRYFSLNCAESDDPSSVVILTT